MFYNHFSQIASIDFSVLQEYLTPESINGLLKMLYPALKILYFLAEKYSKQQFPDATPPIISANSPKRTRRKYRKNKR